LLLEGHDLEALLALVKEQHGPAAKIVTADRVRATGLAGLFSRQRYELTVEVADRAEDPEPATLPPAVDSSALFQASLSSATLAYQANLAAAGTAGIPGSAAAGDAAGSVPPTRLTVTTADVPDPPAANSTAVAVPGTPAAGPTASAADALVALIEEQERRQRPHSGMGAGTGTDQTVSAVEVMPAEHVSADSMTFMPAPPPASSQVVALFQPRPTREAMPGTIIDAVPEPTIEAVPEPTIEAVPADRPLIPRYQPVRLPEDASLGTVLTHLGLPAELCERISHPDSYRAIVKVLKLLPPAPAPPTGAGEVLVVVGGRSGAVAAARSVSESLNLTPDRVLLAAASVAGTGIHASRRLNGPEQAAKRVARLRRLTGMPVIVVVDAPTDGTGTTWACSMVDSLAATAVWAVVDATRKTADSARHLADLGRVDAIAVHAGAATGDPATVLQLGVPVALIDGQVPTPHIWANLMCRRMDEVVAE
jgi:hypothetical protein